MEGEGEEKKSRRDWGRKGRRWGRKRKKEKNH